MPLPDPVDTLRRLALTGRPGAIVVRGWPAAQVVTSQVTTQAREVRVPVIVTAYSVTPWLLTEDYGTVPDVRVTWRINPGWLTDQTARHDAVTEMWRAVILSADSRDAAPLVHDDQISLA